MRVDVVTFHKEYNYGAALQAFGLQVFITQLGHECGIYDYQKKEEKPYFKQRLLNCLLKLNKKNTLIKQKRYKKFYEQYLKTNMNLSCDMYVVGSDQVWNPSCTIDPTFFLNFAPEAAIKISYAASLGVSEIPEDKKPFFRRYLKNFYAISVREDGAKKCIQELTEKNVLVHIDPTLLHKKEFWKTIGSPVSGVPEKYILVYLMHLPKNINKLLSWLQRETKQSIVLLDGQGVVQGFFTNLVKHNVAIHNAGPSEFVWLFDHAQCVVTSSFHGTAFSLIFEKEFYAISDSQGSRISNILGKCGLTAIKETDSCFVRNANIDWSFVSNALKSERESSINYFKEIFDAKLKQ